MSRVLDSARLLKDGLDPEAIAESLGITLSSVLGYLDRAVGEGLIRRSDIYFACPPEKRQRGLIAQRYGNARVAFGDLYDDVRHVETTLHDKVRRALQDHFGQGEDCWWRKGVPEGVRVKCQERRERDPDHPCEAYCYTDLLDLGKIIESQWSLFKGLMSPDYASNRKALIDDLGRFNRIRNRVMHPVRGVAPSDEDFDFVHLVEANLAPRPGAA